ncbi:MAG: MBL fold metallo-hydrolase [Gemmatimonadaceae bacterium]|nr:MBL fold metallo-hydrolase [Gemmatimonadaceae bacterium]
MLRPSTVGILALPCAMFASLTLVLTPHALAQSRTIVETHKLVERPPSGEIRVTLLGTGTPRPLMDRFGPSTLVEAGDEKLIFDVGRGAMQRLFQIDVSYADITAVLLTHLHSDHTVGLPDLWLTGWLISERGTPLSLWGPAGTRTMAEHLEAAFGFDRDIRVRDDRIPAAGGRIRARDIGEQVVFDRGGVKVTSFLVDHGVVRPALGYRVDAGGRSVVLSGDTRYSPNLIRHARGVDLLIHEVGAASSQELQKNEHSRTIIEHHTTPEQAARLFNEVHPKLAVFSHIVLRGIPVEAVMRTTRLTYSGPLELGEDLMRFHVGDRVTLERMSPASKTRVGP